MEVGSGHDNVEHDDGVRDHHRPSSIEHLERSNEKVGRDQPAVEEYREGEQRHHHSAAEEITSRQRVCGEYRQQHVDDRAEHHIERRIRVAGPHLPVLEYRLVPLKTRIDREQLHAARDDRGGRAEGRAHDEDERIEHREQHDTQNRRVDDDKDPVTP